MYHFMYQILTPVVYFDPKLFLGPAKQYNMPIWIIMSYKKKNTLSYNDLNIFLKMEVDLKKMQPVFLEMEDNQPQVW